MNVNIWDVMTPEYPVKQHSTHTEFAVSVDFSMFDPNLLASCGWDGRVVLWNYGEGEQQPI
jgi:WD40 repeat protein